MCVHVSVCGCVRVHAHVVCVWHVVSWMRPCVFVLPAQHNLFVLSLCAQTHVLSAISTSRNTPTLCSLPASTHPLCFLCQFQHTKNTHSVLSLPASPKTPTLCCLSQPCPNIPTHPRITISPTLAHQHIYPVQSLPARTHPLVAIITSPTHPHTHCLLSLPAP